MEQKKEETKFFDFTEVEMEVSFDEKMAVDISKTLGNVIARKFWGAQGVTWTLRSQQDFDTAVKEGWLPIFEGFRP